MKAKKVKKYVVGGYIQAGLGVAQTAYGLSQAPKARRDFERAMATAPSLDTPSQYYENYRNAYDSELARMQDDMIQSNISGSVQALQSAGGRALVGGLAGVNAQAQNTQMQMLKEERGMRMQAGQQLARAEEGAIGRKESRNRLELDMANKSYQAALGNVASGLGSIGSGLMYGLDGSDKKKKGKPEDTKAIPLENSAQLPVKPWKDDVLMRPEMVNQNMILDSYQDGITDSIIRQKKYDDGFNKSLTEANTPVFREQPNAYQRQYGKRTYGYKDINETDNSFMAPVQQVDGNTVFNDGRIAPGSGAKRGLSKLGINTEQQGSTDLLDLFPYVMDNVVPMLKPGWMPIYSGYTLENGGMVTPGEFNHDTNPIDLIHNGEKIGEATGGEAIVNSEQMKKIAAQSVYAKNLFKKFAKNMNK